MNGADKGGGVIHGVIQAEKAANIENVFDLKWCVEAYHSEIIECFENLAGKDFGGGGRTVLQEVVYHY